MLWKIFLLIVYISLKLLESNSYYIYIYDTFNVIIAIHDRSCQKVRLKLHYGD